MAKASVINLTHFTRPDINLNVFVNPSYPLDTRIRLMNPSNYQVAVKMDCGIQVNGSPIQNFYPEYTGREYWIISFRRCKEGHFNILVILEKAGIISNEEFTKINKTPNPFDTCLIVLRNKFNDLPSITMDIKIECENEMRICRRLFPKHYDFDFNRRVWIPKLTTSEKPDWNKFKISKSY